MRLVIDIYSSRFPVPRLAIPLGFSKFDICRAARQPITYGDPSPTWHTPPRCINLRDGAPGQRRATSASAKASDLVPPGKWSRYNDNNMPQEVL
jgi:hypothetical protein